MREVAGAILVLAGSVLVAAGIVADAVSRDQGGHGNAGYVLGAIVGLVGVALLVSMRPRRAWDAIPVDDNAQGIGQRNLHAKANEAERLKRTFAGSNQAEQLAGSDGRDPALWAYWLEAYQCPRRSQNQRPKGRNRLRIPPSIENLCHSGICFWGSALSPSAVGERLSGQSGQMNP